MVLHQIIVREAIRYGARFFKFEKKAFDKLYRDYPVGVGRGVRHGLTVGSAVGSLINKEEDLLNGGISQKSRNGSPASSQDKARGRFAKRSGGKYFRKSKFDSYCRRPYSGKRRGSRNRF